MTCVKCHSMMSPLRKIDMGGEHRGLQVTVNILGHECETCGYKMVEGRHMADYMSAVSDAYRRLQRLMTSAEIKGGRERLGMSQQDFAEYLGVGVASLKRWENGEIQSKSTDELIRLKTSPAYAEQILDSLYHRLAARTARQLPSVGGGETITSTNEFLDLVA